MSEPRIALGVGAGVFLGFNVDLPLPFLLQCYLLARGFIISKVPPAVELRTEEVEEVFMFNPPAGASLTHLLHQHQKG